MCQEHNTYGARHNILVISTLLQNLPSLARPPYIAQSSNPYPYSHKEFISSFDSKSSRSCDRNLGAIDSLGTGGGSGMVEAQVQ